MGNGNYHFRQLLVLFLPAQRSPQNAFPPHPAPLRKKHPHPKNRGREGGGVPALRARHGAPSSSHGSPRACAPRNTDRPRGSPRGPSEPPSPHPRQPPAASGSPSPPPPPPQNPNVLFPPALRRFLPSSRPRAAPSPHRVPPPAATGAPRPSPTPSRCPPFDLGPPAPGAATGAPEAAQPLSPGPPRPLCPPPLVCSARVPPPPAPFARRLPVLGAQRAKGSPAAERGLRLGRPRRIERGLGGVWGRLWGLRGSRGPALARGARAVAAPGRALHPPRAAETPPLIGPMRRRR